MRRSSWRTKHRSARRRRARRRRRPRGRRGPRAGARRRSPPPSGCVRSARGDDRGSSTGVAARARWRYAHCRRTPACAPGASEQLERRLAVAVFEVLARETVAVDGEQQLTPERGHERNRFDGIQRSRTDGTAHARRRPPVVLSRLLSGRHASMSRADGAHTPLPIRASHARGRSTATSTATASWASWWRC